MTPLVQAVRTTDRFVSHYSHAAPFDRRALETVWSRCRVEGCQEARLEAEAQVGALPDGVRDAGTGRAPPLTPGFTTGTGTDVTSASRKGE